MDIVNMIKMFSIIVITLIIMILIVLGVGSIISSFNQKKKKEYYDQKLKEIQTTRPEPPKPIPNTNEKVEETHTEKSNEKVEETHTEKSDIDFFLKKKNSVSEFGKEVPITFSNWLSDCLYEDRMLYHRKRTLDGEPYWNISKMVFKIYLYPDDRFCPKKVYVYFNEFKDFPVGKDNTIYFQTDDSNREYYFVPVIRHNIEELLMKSILIESNNSIIMPSGQILTFNDFKHSYRCPLGYFEMNYYADRLPFSLPAYMYNPELYDYITKLVKEAI